ncbi:MAG: hypothetical protein HDT28_05065 [Clostridiales bacterium]|nr:hypothetical protein [Clostridiales bacterium]
MRTERRTIDNVILINPLICGLQNVIEREQESVIADLVTPAHKIVQKLFKLDNRRIDLCNLNVLYGFIERALGDKFGLFRSCVFGGVAGDSDDYKIALSAIELAGYTVERINTEFEYLFKLIKRKPKRAVKSAGFTVNYKAVASN